MSEALRVRVTTPAGPIPLVWTVVSRHCSPLGEVVELAAAGRRLVVPIGWVTETEEQAPRPRQV